MRHAIQFLLPPLTIQAVIEVLPVSISRWRGIADLSKRADQILFQRSLLGPFRLQVHAASNLRYGLRYLENSK
ncbi:hypothetical protein N018_03250 [Pseudomonas syringae CC1557]|uniref:Uncharacterized protein n=1 Tax=Pseudomonas syringae CC1557 TaxID=1357279 RepID=W0MY33_PSESX|nr:hypothetical protein N018_03250 [Pseudomonas syringae CC1557]